MGNFEQLREAMRKRADELKPAMAAAALANARLIQRRSVANMDRDIYAKPPDAKPGATASQVKRAKQGGKNRKWTRTGNLKREEQAKPDIQDGGLTVVLVNRVRAKSGGGGYSHARHNLALKPGDSRIIPPPPSRDRESDRIAPFRADAIIATEDARLDNYRQAALGVLRKTKV